METDNDLAKTLSELFSNWQKARDDRRTAVLTDFSLVYEDADFFPSLNYYFGHYPLQDEIGYHRGLDTIILAPMEKGNGV